MLSRHSVRTHQGNEYARKWSGYTRPQLPQLAEPLWTDPWPEGEDEIVTYHLTSTLKKNKKKHRSGNMIRRSFPIILRCGEKPLQQQNRRNDSHIPCMTQSLTQHRREKMTSSISTSQTDTATNQHQCMRAPYSHALHVFVSSGKCMWRRRLGREN